ALRAAVAACLVGAGAVHHYRSHGARPHVSAALRAHLPRRYVCVAAGRRTLREPLDRNIGLTPLYEDRHTRPLPPRRFALRMANHLAAAMVLIGVSLVAGIWGYEDFEHFAW